MPRQSKVKGMNVVTVAEGKKVGKVDQLLVDPDTRSVAWIRVDNPGIFTGHRWAPTSVIRAIGDDGLLVQSESDLREFTNTPEVDALLKAKREMLGKKVLSLKGQQLGQVQDYDFDADTFAVTEMMISYGGLLDPKNTVRASDVHTIGVDALIVDVADIAGATDELEVDNTVIDTPSSATSSET